MKAVLPTVDDVPGIFRLIDIYSKTGIVLKRSPEEITKHINDFRVVKKEERVVGCVSLYIYNADLAELRTLIVAPEYQGQGIGIMLVEALKEWVIILNIKKLFTLTVEVDFFKRRGFSLISKSVLPEKIFKDCQHCLYQDQCLETALLLTNESRGH